MTQSDLAARLNFSRGSVANIELGRQRMLLHTVYEIAEALDCTIADLLGLTPFWAKKGGQ